MSNFDGQQMLREIEVRLAGVGDLPPEVESLIGQLLNVVELPVHNPLRNNPRESASEKSLQENDLAISYPTKAETSMADPVASLDYS